MPVIRGNNSPIALFGYMWAHPGKLLFMGGELASAVNGRTSGLG
jgi:1,4-alpha-glucan branching enzyme